MQEVDSTLTKEPMEGKGGGNHEDEAPCGPSGDSEAQVYVADQHLGTQGAESPQGGPMGEMGYTGHMEVGLAQLFPSLGPLMVCLKSLELLQTGGCQPVCQPTTVSSKERDVHTPMGWEGRARIPIHTDPCAVPRKQTPGRRSPHRGQHVKD